MVHAKHFQSQISIAILPTVCHTILEMLFRRVYSGELNRQLLKAGTIFCLYVQPLHILHTLRHTFLKVLLRRICLIINSLLSWLRGGGVRGWPYGNFIPKTGTKTFHQKMVENYLKMIDNNSSAKKIIIH